MTLNKTSLFFRNRGFWPRFLFACLMSFGVLAICSKSSFLYPMNDWVDVHCFFTVGRGMLHGLTPYLDLYEQKGPLIYFLFALAGAISETSFLGVWIIECLCYGWFLYLAGRIAETLAGSGKAWWIGAAVTAVLIPLTPAFSHGSSAEELILPILACGLLTVLKAQTDSRLLTRWEGLSLGLCAAAALWTKYTFCGLFFGLALAVALWYLLTGKGRDLPGLILYFLIGATSLSILILLWFAAKGALSALWQAYFVDNLTRYSQNIRGGRYDAPLPNLLNNLPWSIPGVFGLIFLAVRPRKTGWQALSAWLGAVGLFVFTYWSGRRYPYYALPLSVFAPLGPGAACALLRPLAAGLQPRVKTAAVCALSVLLLAGGPLLSYRLSPNTYLMQIKKEETPPYRFAEIIRQSESPTLLNYGFLDGGFYFASGVLPNGPYFCTLNNDLSEMEKSLQDSIQQGKTEFVVTRSKELPHNTPYKLVDQASMVFEGRQWKYFLYQVGGSR